MLQLHRWYRLDPFVLMLQLCQSGQFAPKRPLPLLDLFVQKLQSILLSLWDQFVPMHP